jgi:hypothetical protein
LTPAEQAGYLRSNCDEHVEVVTDIYWIFVRHKATWQALQRAPDAGKWLLVVPADESILLRHALKVLPVVNDGVANAAKFTNLSTPRGPERNQTAVILAYCREAGKDALRQRLEPLWGGALSWKSNRETFAARSSSSREFR